MNAKLIAKHLAYLRKNHGLTQDELAEKIGVSRQAVSHWECGVAMPDVGVLLDLSKLYEMTINEILEPDIIVGKLKSFEQLQGLSEEEAKVLQELVLVETLVKAYMATSQVNAKWMEENLKDIDFPQEKAKIGRVRVQEVIEAQNEIVNMINLYMR